MSSLNDFFSAKTIAVIGASRDSSKVGHQVLKNLLISNKKIFPINPHAHQILGLKVYRSILDVNSSIDLAIVCVNFQLLEQVIDEVCQTSVKAVLIITAGLAETGIEGKQLQTKLIGKLEKKGILAIGPNSLGFIYPRSQLNASFANSQLMDGHLAILSQSGSMMGSLISALEENMLGFSLSISLGNQAMVDLSQALDFALSDQQTHSIVVYVESTNWRNLLNILRSKKIHKRIYLLKGGKTATGVRASQSHTAAIATDYRLIKAAANQFGICLVDSVQALIEISILDSMTQIKLDNLMLITNAGGPSVNTADLIELSELKLANWSTHSKNHLNELLNNVSIANPLDLLGDATPDEFSLSIRQAQADQQISAIFLILTAQSTTKIEEIIETICRLKGKKPIFLSLINQHLFVKYQKKLHSAKIFTSQYPDQIVELIKLSQQSQAIFPSKPAEIATDRSKAMLTDRPFDLESLIGAIKAYQLPLVDSYLIDQPSMLTKLHYPLFAKAASLSIAHKQLSGAIYGKVENQTQAKSALNALRKFADKVWFQKLIQAESEVFISLERDQTWGERLIWGYGGSLTNIIDDHVIGFLPIDQRFLRQLCLKTKITGQLSNRSDFPQIFSQLLKTTQQIIAFFESEKQLNQLEINPLSLIDNTWQILDLKAR